MSREKQIEGMAKVIAIPCYKRIEVYGDGSKECPSPLPCNECTAELLYNAGYHKQEWISVEERLPDFEGKYLVCTIKGNVTIAYCYSPSWESNPQFDYWVTHWMPLPNPPKGD